MNRRRCVQLAVGAPFVLRAARPAVFSARPTPEQLAWQDRELSMFVHFGPAAWQNREYDDLSTPLDRINPSRLDTEQWADVAQSFGARQIVFVAKHTGGFCWWQTATSKYSVAHTPWRSGKGDVMRDLSASCRKRGLRLGVYLSPQDHSLGVGLGGKCDDPGQQQRYNAIYRQQLTELLSSFGEITEVWFDGSSVIDVGDILKQRAPHAMIFQSPYATIRWVGNEDGIAPDPNWNAVSRDAARSGVSTAKDGTPNGDTWLPCEVDARMHDTWFWNTESNDHLKSVDRLMSIYYRSVGHGAVLLLNQTPDLSGLIPDAHARRAAEWGSEVKRRFDGLIAQGKGTRELRFERPTRVDHVVLQEDLAKGQRVSRYSLLARVGENWRELTQGATVGHKKIDSFPALEVAAIRFQSESEYPLRSLAAFYVGTRNSEPATETLTYKVIYNWRPDSFDGGRTTWDIDLKPFVRDAAQYELSFVVTGGGIIIRAVTLLADGVTHDEYVSVVRQRVYRITIPGLGTTLDLRVAISPEPGDPAFGQIVLSR